MFTVNRPTKFFCFCFLLQLAAWSNAQTFEITIRGEVEFNQINGGELGGVAPGDSVFIALIVDTQTFMDSTNFPTRGYPVVDVIPFGMFFGNGSVARLQSPFPVGQMPFFVLRDDDPAVDGFFLSTNIEFPVGVPLDQTGQFSQFTNDFSVTYTGETLSTLNIEDIDQSSFDFSGLTVFNWTINDGPFSAMGIVFERLEVGEVFIDFKCGFPVGDVNMDREVNLLDVNDFVDALVFGQFICEADVNCDGVVDILDVQPIVSLLAGS